MSPRLPAISGRDAVTVLKRAGFAQIGQRGSHLKMRNPEGRIVIVPLHRELARGTLRSILRQANVSDDQFLDLLRSH